MGRKIKKEELKGPERLQVIFLSFLTWAREHKRKIIIASIVIGFVAVSLTGWFLWQQNREGKAMKEYNQAVESLHLLRTHGKENEVTKKFEEIANNYRGTRAAELSLYRLGILHIRTNHLEEALKAFREFLTSGAPDDEIRALVVSSMGYCYEVKGDYKKALEEYEKVINSKGGKAFVSTGYANIARCYEHLKDYEKAKYYYQKALEQSVDQNMREILNWKLISLGVM
ncbi:MAG: tetratricopeptide repeat protein [Syntrophales bacterium]|nr:tetratricopeptide repeat protein [Syntrophales bacterium]